MFLYLNILNYRKSTQPLKFIYIDYFCLFNLIQDQVCLKKKKILYDSGWHQLCCIFCPTLAVAHASPTAVWHRHHLITCSKAASALVELKGALDTAAHRVPLLTIWSPVSHKSSLMYLWSLSFLIIDLLGFLSALCILCNSPLFI